MEKALELFPHDNAEKGDWLAHLGEAIYRNGRKEEGERVILEGVQQIQAHHNDYDSFCTICSKLPLKCSQCIPNSAGKTFFIKAIIDNLFIYLQRESLKWE